MPETATKTDFDFSEAEIQQMLANLDDFDHDEVEEIDKLVGELSKRKRNEAAFNDLISF